MILALSLPVPKTLLIFLPLNWILGVVLALALWTVATGFLWFTAPVLVLNGTELQAGRARLDYRYIDRIDPVTLEKAREEKGVLLDARAHLVIRPWITTAVKVYLDDARDPTPYWLVSTRKPQTVTSEWEKSTGS
jgi:Protein of unknown function (DUF3093).